MPLHEWTDRAGWEGMHHLWITELLRWVKPRLPAGYRAYIGSAPLLAVGAPRGRPDVHVHRWPEDSHALGAGKESAAPRSSGDAFEPDVEIAVATLDPGTALMIERQGRLVAAVELVSPRNKDRPTAREAYLARYLGYLLESVNLLLVDVHRLPLGFSFADRIAAALSMECQPLSTPLAVSYRVGEPAATGGRYLALWRRSLSAGDSLPEIPLSLDIDSRVLVDLERTYSAAAADAYVS
jgi:Protein of unknown function (DUF4058)